MMATQPMIARTQRQQAADRSLPAAAEQLEGVVQRRTTAAPSERYQTTPRIEQQAAQRDDEGWHADVGDDEALERSDGGTEADAEAERDDPPEREVGADAEDVGQPVGHQQGVDHRDDADQRPDREVDVARDDDEHHARSR